MFSIVQYHLDSGLQDFKIIKSNTRLDYAGYKILKQTKLIQVQNARRKKASPEEKETGQKNKKEEEEKGQKGLPNLLNKKLHSYKIHSNPAKIKMNAPRKVVKPKIKPVSSFRERFESRYLLENRPPGKHKQSSKNLWEFSVSNQQSISCRYG